MSVPSVEGLLTEPYLSVAEFRAAPTYLDSDDLIEGGTASQQDYELYDVLLRASAWADNHCAQRLGAHVAYETARARVDSRGRVYLHPSNNPVRQVTGLAYGPDPSFMTVLTDLTQIWPEDERGLVVGLLPMRGMWAGTLEFGRVPASGRQMFIEYTYVAGFANTALSADAAAGSSSLTVKDGTGFIAPSTGLLGTLRGSTARIWDPGKEEAVTVASGYTSGTSPIPLTASLSNAHFAGTVVSEFPAEVRQAIISYSVSLLLREDVEGEDPFANTPYGPTARKARSGGKAGGLVSEAEKCLNRYQRVR